jgi:sulfur carrier protein ThiS
LFDIYPGDGEARLQATKTNTWREDYKFLINQLRIPQQGFMGRVDQEFVDRENRHQTAASTN